MKILYKIDVSFNNNLHCTLFLEKNSDIVPDHKLSIQITKDKTAFIRSRTYKLYEESYAMEFWPFMGHNKEDADDIVRDLVEHGWQTHDKASVLPQTVRKDEKKTGKKNNRQLSVGKAETGPIVASG